jgi:hypothetical protein
MGTLVARAAVLGALALAAVGLAPPASQLRAQESPIDFLMNQAWQAEEARRRAAQRRSEDAARQATQQRRQREQAARQAAKQRRLGLDLPDESARVVELPKAPDARAILVMGDEMAEGLAQGLREMLANEPGIDVKVRAVAGAGLSREGLDWTAILREGIREERPIAVVVFLGVWDRSALADGTKPPAARLSDRWRQLYAARVDALLAAAMPAHDFPMFWIGLPVMRAAELTTEATIVNDILKQRIFASGHRFVDGWDGFVDENGRYVAIGPDVSGAPRRLRRPDGVGLTPAGHRKLALFVDTEIRRLIDFGVFPGARMVDAPGPPTMPREPEAVPSETPVRGPFIGQPMHLTPVPAARAGDLGIVPASADDDLGRRVLRAGEVLAPRSGRADDHRWPATPMPAEPRSAELGERSRDPR